MEIEINNHYERQETSMPDVPMTRPGENLAEILEDLGLSASEFAKATGIEEKRLRSIVKTQEPITADVAVRIGKVLDMTPEFWLSLQSDYDLEMTSGVTAEVEPITGVVIA